MGLLDNEIAKWKRAFSLLSDIDVSRDPGYKAAQKGEQALYDKSAIYKSLKDAYTAPVRALRGEIDPYSVEGAKEALNLAGAVGVSGMSVPMKSGPGTLGMFIGRGAKTWDALMEAEALKMLKQGKTPRPRNALGQETYNTPVLIDSRKAKKIYESAHGEPLAWSKEKLASIKEGKGKSSLPPQAGIDAQGRFGINDGRHRLDAAADTGNPLEMYVPSEDIAKLESLGLIYKPPSLPINALGQKIPPTQYELAHAEAQRVAALPVEQGGLGLPAGNTAMERARAMGYNLPSLHGSSHGDIQAFTPGVAEATYVSVPSYRPGSKTQAEYIAEGPFGGVIYPLQVNAGKQSTKLMEWPQMPEIMHSNPGSDTYRVYEPSVQGTSLAIPDSSRIRSRFAAFNPAKRDSADLLAGLYPYAATGLLGSMFLLPNDAEAR